MKKKILTFISVGILMFVGVTVIEFCCIYAAEGDNIWSYLKGVWDWYKTLLI
ncbi:MAG: hypothetical protein K2N22_07125 [Clostridia bacterium]|nr:hypothetical protein [Clostridia bacterium]